MSLFDDDRTIFERTRTMQPVPPLPAEVPTPIPFNCYEFEFLDEAAFTAVEPGPYPTRGVLRLNAPWLEEHTVMRDGEPWLRLVPTDTRDDALDVTHAILDAILDDAGDDELPQGQTDEWIEQATVWARAALGRQVVGPLEQWRGERAARVAQAADRLLRGFCLPRDLVEQLTGAPTTSTRWLTPVGHDAHRLAEAKRAAEEARRRAEAAAAAAAVQAAKPLTWRDLGAQAVRCERERLGAVAMEPFAGAVIIGSDDARGTVTYGWRVLPGCEVPGGHVEGFEFIPRDEVAPQLPRPLGEFTTAALVFARQVRKRCMQVDTGPIAPKRFTDRGLDRARELVVEYGGVFRKAYGSPDTWRRGWLLEALVRGLLVHPGKATALVTEFLSRGFLPTLLPATQYGPPGRPMREVAMWRDDEHPSHNMLTSDVAQLAANAARGGETDPGELLDAGSATVSQSRDASVQGKRKTAK